jgi:hypothetical protein
MTETLLSVAELLAFRRNPAASALVIMSAEDCPPCQLVEEALHLVDFPAGVAVMKAVASPADKKTMGAVLKAGINNFPCIEVYAGGQRLAQHHGAVGNDSRQVAHWLNHIARDAEPSGVGEPRSEASSSLRRG